MKKLLLALTTLILVFTLASCDTEYEVTFKIDDETIETVTTEEGELTSYPTPELEDKYFLGWFADEAYDERFDLDTEIEGDATFYGKTMPYDGDTLETPLTDELTLEPEDYEGKSFPEDGIGEAELNYCIDGDTTNFYDSHGNDVRIRYLHMDTPESTADIEPWGKASSEYVCNALEDAETIVLEYEPHPEEGHPEPHPSVGRIGTYNRDLAYIWYDGRLLNLELIELAYATGGGFGQSQYGDLLRLADANARMSGRRVHGEDDPDYLRDDPLEASVSELVENIETYSDRFVHVEGVVSGTDSDGFYLADQDTGDEVYFFTMNSPANISRISEGNLVRIEYAFYQESAFSAVYQLTDFDDDDLSIIRRNVEIPE